MTLLSQANNRKVCVILVLCVLLGFYDNDESKKLLWDYYHYMKQRYPNDTYSDGPLLGLIEIGERRREILNQNLRAGSDNLLFNRDINFCSQVLGFCPAGIREFHEC